MGCRPRRRGVPLRRPVSSTPSSVRRSSALNAERAHFCARPRPARFWFPYAGMPDLVVRPAKSDLRLKIAYGRSSLRGRGPHDGGRVCACPSAVTLKAAVSRAAESDCQTDRTRRLSAVVGRRDRSGSSRPRSERRASTVPAALLKPAATWIAGPPVRLCRKIERTAHPGGASEGADISPDVSSPLTGRSVDRARVPSGFRPRGFSRPAVAGVGRRARRAWKLKVALPGGLEPPACGLGNRRSVLMSYGSMDPRKTPGLARAHCGTDASAHYAHGVRTDGLLRDPDVVVYGEEFCEAPSRGELSGASFGRPWLCAPIRFPFAV